MRTVFDNVELGEFLDRAEVVGNIHKNKDLLNTKEEQMKIHLAIRYDVCYGTFKVETYKNIFKVLEALKIKVHNYLNDKNGFEVDAKSVIKAFDNVDIEKITIDDKPLDENEQLFIINLLHTAKNANYSKKFNFVRFETENE